MEDPADPPVDDLLAAHDAAAADVREPLVAEADAEHRDLALGERRAADAEVALALGAARARARRRSGPTRGAASALHSISSLRTTTGSSPATLAMSWYRLNVYES